VRAAVAAALLGGAVFAAAGCGGSSPVNPVAARSSRWVREANTLCLPRDRAIPEAELAAKPVFFTPAVDTEIHAEAIALRRLGVFQKIPLLAYKWKLALHRLDDRDPAQVDGQVYAAHKVMEPYGIRCQLGTIPPRELTNL
jgi:hypothetical protein